MVSNLVEPPSSLRSLPPGGALGALGAARHSPTWHSPRRTALGVLLVIAVSLGHGCVTQLVAERMADFGTARAMPARMAVAYVRELQLAPPPVVAPPAPAPPPRPKRSAAAAAALPASAALPPPEPTPEPAPPPPEPTATVEPPAEPTPALPLLAEATTPSDAASAGVGVNALGVPFEWPPSTRVSYTLTGNFRGEVHGDAQVQWVHEGARYQVHIDVSVGPSFAPIITRSMTSEGELASQHLVPSRYDEDTKVMFRERRRVTVLLGPDEIVLANGQRRERVAGVQDAASQFVHLAALFTTRPELLQVGGTVELLLALPRNIDLWVYDVLAAETLDTSFGPVDTFHLKPRRVAARGSDLTAEVWYAPQLRYLPVRIRIHQDAETFIDLLIARRPEVAAQ